MTAKWKQRLRREAQAFGQLLRPARLAPLAAGAAVLTFGLHNIHAQTGITEGGVLGLLLFVNHWTGLPASVVSPVLDLLCYLLALRFLGGQFIRTSLISTAAVALCFKFWESFPYLLPDLSGAPLAAALLGGVFVGVGVGVIVRGERTALQGANGSGKSTLFQLLLGNQKVSEGTLGMEQGLKISYVP